MLRGTLIHSTRQTSPPRSVRCAHRVHCAIRCPAPVLSAPPPFRGMPRQPLLAQDFWSRHPAPPSSPPPPPHPLLAQDFWPRHPAPRSARRALPRSLLPPPQNLIHRTAERSGDTFPLKPAAR